MTRVHVICEGQTEEMFVNALLGPHLAGQGIYLYPSLIGKPGHKGGNFKFDRLLWDLRAHLLGDRTAYCTTLFDYYGLPEGFPGKAAANAMAEVDQRADCLLDGLVERLRAKLGDEPLARFVPYIQMYEFEGLLFSGPEKLARAIGEDHLVQPFQKIRDSFPSPENINDSPQTAPSKRIAGLFPAYDKPVHGSLAAIDMGLPVIRGECKRFAQWLKRLESLGPEGAPCA